MPKYAPDAYLMLKFTSSIKKKKNIPQTPTVYIKSWNSLFRVMHLRKIFIKMILHEIIVCSKRSEELSP